MSAANPQTSRGTLAHMPKQRASRRRSTPSAANQSVSHFSPGEIERAVEALRARKAELERENAELRLAHRTLRESEERYRCIVQTAQEGVWTIDAHAKTDFVNRAMARMLGYTVEEMLGRPLEDFMDEEGRRIANRNLDRRRQGIAERHEFKFRRKDGSDVWTLLAANPITNEQGKYAGALAMVADITDRKRWEAALAESEEKFRVLFDNAGDGIIIMEGDRAVDCNARALEMLRCESRNQVVGHSASEFAPAHQPDGHVSRKVIRGRISAALAGDPQVFEWTHRRLDGTTFPSEVTLNAVRLRGAVLLQAIVRDVTRRKEAEGALAKTLALLERTGEIAKVGGWELDLRTMEHYWSRETCRILEVDSQKAPPLEQGINFYAPEAQPIIAAAVRAAIERGTPYDLELPLVTAKGRRIWVRAQGSAVWEGGRVIKLLGALHDVTDRKKAESEVARVTDLLERTGELAKVGGWELDLLTKEVSWSLETCRIHEVETPIAPGLERAVEFYAPESRPILEAALRAATERGTPYDLELQLITAKGRRIWVRAQGSAIKAGGKVVKLIGAFQDPCGRAGAPEGRRLFARRPVPASFCGLDAPRGPGAARSAAQGSGATERSALLPRRIDQRLPQPDLRTKSADSPVARLWSGFALARDLVSGKAWAERGGRGAEGDRYRRSRAAYCRVSRRQ